jgi:hypothetical protein
MEKTTIILKVGLHVHQVGENEYEISTTPSDVLIVDDESFTISREIE